MTNYLEHLSHIQKIMGKLGKDVPETMGAFSKLHKASAGDGALDSMTKEK